MNNKILAQNRKANFDYEISKKYQAGVVLFGHEVKAAKAGKVNITGSTVILNNGRPVLINANIDHYQANNTPSGYNPKRDRELLLNKKEISEISRLKEEKKLTIIPLSVYSRDTFIKLEFGLGKKRKKSDKREAIKKKETKRAIRKIVK